MSVTDRELRAKLGSDTADSDLVEYLETEAGTDLRCAVEYDETGWDALYTREDMQREEYEPLFEELQIQVRAAAARESDSALDAGPQITVTCYETRSVVHVHRGDSRNVAILLDANATPQIRAFARACRDRLEG